MQALARLYSVVGMEHVSLYSLEQGFLALAFGSTALVVLVWSCLKMAKGTSAAVRHRVWLMVFFGLLILPAGLMVLPSFELPILPASTSGVTEQTPEPILQSDDSSIPSTNHGIHDGTKERVHWLPIADPFTQDLKSTSRNANFPPPEMEDDQTESASNTGNPETWARRTATPTNVPIPNPAMSKTELSRLSIYTSIWGSVAFLLLIPLVVAAGNRRRFIKCCDRIDNGDQFVLLNELRQRLGLRRFVILYRSDKPVLPMTWGESSPVIVLPSTSEGWSEKRLTVVMLHELAHIKRRDGFSQAIARLTSALYWFQPLVWLALRRLRQEREMACDDQVMSYGHRPSEYATQLVQIAREYKSQYGLLAMSMSTSRLEERIVSLLDSTRSHSPVSRLSSVCMWASCLLIVGGLSSIQISRQVVAAESSIGIVSVDLHDDQSDSQNELGKTSTRGEGVHRSSNEIPVPETLPPAGQIINEYIKAVGGAMRLEAVESLRMDGQVTNVTGEVEWSTHQFTWLKGNWKSWFPSESGEFTCGVDHRRVWKKPVEDKAVWIDHRSAWWYLSYDCCPSRALDWLNFHEVISVVGMEEIDGMKVYRLDFCPQRDVLASLYFDADSSLLVKSTHYIFVHPITRRFSNYRTVDGLKLPFRTETFFEKENLAWRWDVSQVTVDGDVLPKDVAVPDSLINDPGDLWVQGVVRDKETGNPIPDVRIFAGNVTGQALAVTDKDGQYRIFDPLGQFHASNTARVSVVPSDLYPYLAKTVKLTVVEKGDNIDIEMRQAEFLYGSVVNEVTGEPVPVWMVNFDFDPTTQDLDDFWTQESRFSGAGCYGDSAGGFCIPVVPGTIKLEVFAKDHERYQHVSEKRSSNSFVQLDTRKVDLSKKLVIELDPYPSRYIAVFNSEGRPQTKLHTAGVYPEHRSYSKNELDQSFFHPEVDSPVEVFGLTANEQRTLFFLNAETSSGAVTMVNGDQAQWEHVELKPCASLRGEFHDFDRDVFRGYLKWVASVGDQPLCSCLVEQDDNRFELPYLIPGVDISVSLEANIVRGSSLVHAVKTVEIGELTPGQVIDLGKIDLLEELTVRGIVRDSETGDPVAGAVISSHVEKPGSGRSRVWSMGASRSAVVSAADGTYSMDFPSAGMGSSGSELMLGVLPPDGVSTLLPTTVPFPVRQSEFGTVSLDISMLPAHQVKGKIVDRETGEPVRGTATFASWDNGNPVHQDTQETIMPAINDDSGTFLLGVPDGAGEVRIRADAWGQFQPDPQNPKFNLVLPYQFDTDNEDSGLLFELIPVSSVSLDVKLESGEPAREFIAMGQFTQKYNRYTLGFPPTRYVSRMDDGAGGRMHESFSDSIEIFGMEDRSPRLLLLFQPQDSVGAVRWLEGGAEAMVNLDPIVLRPCATITGMLGKDETVSSESIYVNVRTDVPNLSDKGQVSSFRGSLRRDGTFEIPDILPGIAYEVRFSGVAGLESFEKIMHIDPVIAGKTINLGEIDLMELEDVGR